MTDAELTVDQLAAAVGMTVRNVRAYATRGLLPPPRLVGRTGYYGPEHVARLELVREMLAEGYTLAEVEQTLAGLPPAASATALALHRALMAPWMPEVPEETDRATLAARAGLPAGDEELMVELANLGVVEVLDGDRLRVLDPTLLTAGLQVVRLGIPPRALLAAQREVVEHVEAAARAYVRMFHETVWQAHVDAGAPADGWPRIERLVERIQPVAAQALLASFRTAMAAAVAEEFAVALRDIPGADTASSGAAS